jgi:hypothetical protein
MAPTYSLPAPTQNVAKKATFPMLLGYNSRAVCRRIRLCFCGLFELIIQTEILRQGRHQTGRLPHGPLGGTGRLNQRACGLSGNGQERPQRVVSILRELRTGKWILGERQVRETRKIFGGQTCRQLLMQGLSCVQPHSRRTSRDRKQGWPLVNELSCSLNQADGARWAADRAEACFCLFPTSRVNNRRAESPDGRRGTLFCPFQCV